MEVSLGEASQTQHRYQISRGQDGEVNIDVVVEELVMTILSAIITKRPYLSGCHSYKLVTAR